MLRAGRYRCYPSTVRCVWCVVAVQQQRTRRTVDTRRLTNDCSTSLTSCRFERYRRIEDVLPHSRRMDFFGGFRTDFCIGRSVGCVRALGLNGDDVRQTCIVPHNATMTISTTKLHCSIAALYSHSVC